MIWVVQWQRVPGGPWVSMERAYRSRNFAIASISEREVRRGRYRIRRLEVTFR